MFGLELPAGFIFVISIVLLIWAILWFFVPFYISTMNKNIRALLSVNNKILDALKKMDNNSTREEQTKSIAKQPPVVQSKKANHNPNESSNKCPRCGGNDIDLGRGWCNTCMAQTMGRKKW